MTVARTAEADLPLDAALERIGADGLVGYPTETVWGLGAAAASDAAVARLRAWKGRDEGQPISVLVPDLEAAEALGAELPDAARRLAAAFWPGPLTLVLRCRRRLATGVGRADGGLGLRCSPHPAARALARGAWERGIGPITATSLNRGGAPPARRRAEARAVCGAGPDAPGLLGGPWPDAGGAAASSVVDLTGADPVVLREGALGCAQIAGAIAGTAA